MKKILNHLLANFNLKIINLKYRTKQFTENDSVLYLNFDHVVSNYVMNMKNNGAMNFIQIGAFDGVMSDPIRRYIMKYNWNGIMIEPQQQPFLKLSTLYSENENITLLNCVVSKSTDKVFLYVVEDPNGELPEWISGSASFDRNNLIKYNYLLPEIESYVREVMVNSITMDELLRINGGRHIDLLQIDAEGYDGELLKLFPFDKVKPNIIHFECKNLKKSDLELILHMLISHNYEIAFDGDYNKAEDMIAVLNASLSA